MHCLPSIVPQRKALLVLGPSPALLSLQAQKGKGNLVLVLAPASSWQTFGAGTSEA